MVRISPLAIAVPVEFPDGARGGTDLVHVDFLQGLSGLEARGLFASVVVEGQSISVQKNSR
jgi:lipid-binding SYLF domain-containing protein